MDPKTHRFFAAIAQGDQAQVSRLLGEEPRLLAARDEKGLSAILAAAYQGKASILAFLLAQKPDLDLFEAAAVGDLGRLKTLIKARPGSLNAYGRDGFFPLGLACYFRREAAARFLVSCGADVDQKASNGSDIRPIHAAAAADSLALVTLLVEAGASVVAKQKGGFTALHAAAQNGNRPLVAYLLGHGAPAQDLSAEDKTAYDYAKEAGHGEALADLLRLTKAAGK